MKKDSDYDTYKTLNLDKLKTFGVLQVVLVLVQVVWLVCFVFQLVAEFEFMRDEIRLGKEEWELPLWETFLDGLLSLPRFISAVAKS